MKVRLARKKKRKRSTGIKYIYIYTYIHITRLKERKKLNRTTRRPELRRVIFKCPRRKFQNGRMGNMTKF